ncbi:MAG: DUF5615 family PIN-like protein [Deltaproteobacteria bacterium]|nr:DUF5615 family PIN-like protein [Deltaproteobacteria bacterium]
MLRFLADESCDFAVVRGLRSAGFDVTAIVEEGPGMTDSAVLKSAAKDRRILLTEDKDFGEWIFAHKSKTSGVILIRYPSNMRATMTEWILELAKQYGNELLGKFTVLEPGVARIRSLSLS